MSCANELDVEQCGIQRASNEELLRARPWEDAHHKTLHTPGVSDDRRKGKGPPQMGRDPPHRGGVVGRQSKHVGTERGGPGTFPDAE